MKIFVKGKYRQSIFSTDQGYHIGILKLTDTNSEIFSDFIGKTITFTGYFHELNLDDQYLFYGEEVEHPKYGLQFQVSEYERVKPEDRDGIIAFLSSDLFHGIGEKQAASIVDVLGKDTLNKILEDKNNLLLVPKLSQKKIDLIYQTLTKYEESYQMIVYLTELGFSMKDALSIYNTYKGYTLEKIEHNIYQLIDDIPDINFSKVDEISSKLGISYDDERRIKAVIVYIMKKMVFEKGDTYLQKEDIYDQVYHYLQFSIREEDFSIYLHELMNEDKIVIFEEDYYLKEDYEAEREIVYKFSLLLNRPKQKQEKSLEFLETLEKENHIHYNEKQKEAIQKALEENLLIITGGPGTGKSATSLVVK